MIRNEPLDIKPQIDPSVYARFDRLSKERAVEKIRPVPILESKKVTKEYDGQLVIPPLDFCVDDIESKAEIISMLGPSGCGKSTILRMIAGLENPTTGEMLMKGQRIEGPGMERGMIFQKYSSFPFLSVLDNIAYPLINVKHMPRKEALERARHWIEKMYLHGAEKKFPHQLSGGMQQRVAIARTLCMDAQVILMDEPFGALDRKIRWEMQDLIAEIAFFKPEQEFTIILVTHDIPEALYLGDRIWIIYKGRLVHMRLSERPTEPARIAQGRKEFQDTVSYFNEQIDNLMLEEEPPAEK